MKNTCLPLRIVLCLAILSSMSACASLGTRSIPLDTLSEKYGGTTSNYIEIDGSRIHYRDEGSGPVLVLLHGVCASLHTWDGWVSELRDHFRIIRLDLPGFGLTGPVGRDAYDRDRFVTLLDQFVASLDLDRFSLVGTSLGGYICWNYALEYPHRVDKLILISPAGYSQPMPWLLRFASNPVVRPVTRRMMPRFLIHTAAEQVFGDKSKVNDEIKARYYELAMRPGNRQSYVEIFTVMRGLCKLETLSQGITDLTLPTLIMWGTADEWIPYPYSDKWRQDLPHACFIAYEGAGHTPMEELPRQTARDAWLFLDERSEVP